MRHKLTIVFLLSIFSSSVSAQILTDSNLPIIIIDTDGGGEIGYFVRVLGSMKIIYRGEGYRNYVTDQNTLTYLNYNGRIDIEIRGSSSQFVTKNQYGFTASLPVWMQPHKRVIPRYQMVSLQ